MNLHEYQSKSILKKYGVNVPEGMVASSPEQAVDAAWIVREHSGSDKWAVKAQIHAGGRGKAGGIKIANSFDEVKEYAKQIIGMRLITPQTGAEGKIVSKVLIEQNIFYPGESKIAEYYMSILLNRELGRYMILYSRRGGMDIEQVASETPEQIYREEVEPCIGVTTFQCRKIGFNLGLKGKALKEIMTFVPALYKAFTESDASLAEINPVFKTSDDKIYAADAKVVIDDNALYRHPDIYQMRDLAEEDPIEVEAGKYDLNYIKLNGHIGCMVNGAGLAMATMDIIKLSGGEPANFLDVGGSASAKRVEEGFRIILSDSNVEGILLNIFGGIVRCDIVAQGVVDACRALGEIKVPIIVRLQGTNAAEGKKIIDESGLKVYSALQLQDAADLITTVMKKHHTESN